MAIYINVGQVPSDGGKPWKHMNGRCAFLQELAEAGFPIKRVPNTDGAKPWQTMLAAAVTASSSNWRCRNCERRDGCKPRRLPKRARGAHPSGRTTFTTQRSATLRSEWRATSQPALLSRWRATCKPGFPPDGIPWLNARLAEDKAFQPTLEVRRYASRDAALAAERKLRRRLRVEGWHVSSDVNYASGGSGVAAR